MREPHQQPVVYVHQLGCPKLEVDHDLLRAGLEEAGCRFADRAEEADTVIVSTCAFLGDARAEAVEAMLEGVRWKQEGEERRLLVSGCLPSRYREELAREVPEVDGWYPPGRFDQLIARLGGRGAENLPLDPGSEPDHPGRIPPDLESALARLRSPGRRPWAWLKIAEGCDRRCAYCAIPQIRGPYRSRRPGSILSEASRLLAAGVRELNLTAEEINSWGRDLSDDHTIETLLPRLGEMVADHGGWLRLLYTHPPLFTERFVRTLAATPGLVPYLDYPIEHASDPVLKAMGRGTTWRAMRGWIEMLREAVPEIALRTSVIVGHPGEDEAAFEELLQRLEEVRFARLGVFRYSPEEGTRARRSSHPDEATAIEREEEVRQLAEEQAERWYAERVGHPAEMLVEGRDEEGRPLGRSAWDAPEVDGDAVLEGEAETGAIVRGTVVRGAPWTLHLRP